MTAAEGRKLNDNIEALRKQLAVDRADRARPAAVHKVESCDDTDGSMGLGARARREITGAAAARDAHPAAACAPPRACDSSASQVSCALRASPIIKMKRKASKAKQKK